MKTIALFMRHPECSKDCAYAMVHALSSEYQIRIFEEKELDDDNFFDHIDVIAFPGVTVFNGYQLRIGLTFSVDKGQVSYFKTLLTSKPITFIKDVKKAGFDGLWSRHQRF
ncbi:MAG: hypothetical protein O2966_01565 [Proteobacteria bacterium]|nr:hypothetical protein [Pseudomonadota bacterium]